MNISIRNHIKSNFKDAEAQDIRSSIDDSIGDKDEVTLPGLGVFFEIYWDCIGESDKEMVVDFLYNKLKKTN